MYSSIFLYCIALLIIVPQYPILPENLLQWMLQQERIEEIGNLSIINGNTMKPLISPVYNYLKERAYRLDGQHGGQCVLFVQQFLGIFEDCNYEEHLFRGYAGYIKSNSEEPEIGNAVLFNGHTAIIINIIDEELELVESNYNLDEKITIGRKINKDDKSIRGYFHF